MLNVNIDKDRPHNSGQIFVELISYRDVHNLSDCNRLGYWCDKPHLKHFLVELRRVLSKQDFEEMLNCKILDNECW